MSFLSQIFGTVIGFSAVMLTVSLVVMALVRVVQYLKRDRGKTLGEMLGSLNVGYRLAHGDQAQPGDDAQSAFVLDIMSFPTLHSPATVQKFRSPAKSARGVVQGMDRLSQSVEYISQEDLILIIQRLAALEHDADAAPPWINAPDPSAEVPPRWYGKLSPANRKLDVFIAYVKDWFETVEATTSERFKLATRRLTFTISCVVVVLVNIDSIKLVSNLYHSASARDEMSARAEGLLAMANNMGVAHTEGPPQTDREGLLKDVGGELTQLNTVLNIPDLEFGWESSWICKAWCTYQSHCTSGEVTPKEQTRGDWILMGLRWLVGLTVSCIMLSLGAPFWAGQLKNVLNLRNSVQSAKAGDSTPSSSDAEEDEESPPPKPTKGPA